MVLRKEHIALTAFLALYAVHAEAQEREWLFMVYLAGGNNIELGAVNVFDRMAETGSSDDVAIAVQSNNISCI